MLADVGKSGPQEKERTLPFLTPVREVSGADSREAPECSAKGAWKGGQLPLPVERGSVGLSHGLSQQLNSTSWSTLSADQTAHGSPSS